MQQKPARHSTQPKMNITRHMGIIVHVDTTDMSVEPGGQVAGGKVRIILACHIGEWSISAGKQPARAAGSKRYCVRRNVRSWRKATKPQLAERVATSAA